MPKGEHKSAGDVSADDSVVTVVLLGQNSTDKCLVGNTMLAFKCFQPGQRMYQKALGRVGNELLYIINTPEFFWSPNQDPETNAIEAMKPSYPGSRMFLLVLQNKQLSNEEMEMFTKLKERFGEKIVENITVVLIDSKESSEVSRDTANASLKQILHECNERMCVFSKDMRGVDLVGQLLPEKPDEDLDRSNVDNNKQINPEEKDKSEQPKPMQEESMTIQPSGGEGMTTMVLLGLNSDDKCLIGNSILQHDCFTPGRTICDRVVARVGDQMVCIVNTPDLFVFKPRPDLIADSMEEMQPTYTGPRVFLMKDKQKRNKTQLHTYQNGPLHQSKFKINVNNFTHTHTHTNTKHIKFST
ncbi:uncharacterized protein si:ch211-139n6.3 isoform X2 [Danio rerio]|uniref:Uncharacterized protein si:ch211-139n6.3 isoform X2 n=1 Tax=Danio rerio TaxID=7955 RepID=A0A8M6Z344_DANRE|nr:uncharacterized protein si:ch211-139n6.3 isoform X2 [Danio rerio]|eukprot:XP_017213599.1 uncharacterized protein si:ch211-139n6.3 isoform X2 [Danio rerio]